MSDEITMLERRWKRERNARKQAELLLEKKSLELYLANQELTELANSLEEQIQTRTKELKEARDNALAASRSKTTFLSTMSHEIRTPMNGIIGMANLLLDTGLTHEQKNQASVILSSSESLLSIINDILDLSKLEAGKFELHEQPFNLNELLLDIFNSMAITAANKKLELLCQSNSDVPQALIGDPFRLRQILINLLGNSLKFTQDGFVDLQVSLTESVDDKVSLRFQVNDTGCGIDEESQKTLFTPFSQGKYDVTNPQGTGLGLSICRRLATLMNGSVGLNSTVGEGSSFWFEIPLMIADSESAAQPLQGRYAIYGSHKEILPIIQRQFDALGSELALSDSLEKLTQEDQQAKDSDYDQFIVDLEGLTHSEELQLLSYLRGSIDRSSWLFIRSINEPHSELIDFIQQQTIPNFVKPIIQDKFYQHLKAKRQRVSAVKQPESPSEVLWYEKLSGDSHILLVEDNAVNRMVATALLKKCGFTISVAKDGVEAVEACTETDFSLVLMDIQMPRMGGIEAMKKIRQQLNESERIVPPIIALTANAMEGASEEYMSQGMDDYLTKPIDQDRLGQVLGQWLQKD